MYLNGPDAGLYSNHNNSASDFQRVIKEGSIIDSVTYFENGKESQDSFIVGCKRPDSFGPTCEKLIKFFSIDSVIIRNTPFKKGLEGLEDVIRSPLLLLYLVFSI